MLRPKMGALVDGGNFISRWWQVSAIAVVAACMTAAPAVSRADIIEPFETAAHPFWTLDEVRAGAFKQAIDDAHGEGTGAMNLEVLGGRFAGGYENSILNFFLTPRPHIGTTIAFGKTDEFYFGVTWDARLIGNTFFETSFGGAAHDGPLHELEISSYGCQVNFRAQWATISPSEVWDSFSLVPSNIHAESRTVVHKTPRQRPLLYTTSQLTSCVIHNEYARRRWTINQKIHQGPFAGQQSDR